MKILEYMGMGKADRGAQAGNIEELIEDGSQGRLFDPGDIDSMAAAISEMPFSPNLREMGRRSFETINAQLSLDDECSESNRSDPSFESNELRARYDSLDKSNE